MRISRKYGFVYFSIPKTASEAVRTFLDPLSDVEILTYARVTPDQPFYSHMTAREAEAAFASRNWDYHGQYRFVTVRNPWARLVSLFRMMRRQPQRRTELDFAGFLRTLDPDAPVEPPSDQKWWDHGALGVDAFTCGANGRPLVNDAFRIEDGFDAMIAALRARDVPVVEAQVETVNAARTTQDYRDYYGPEERDHVARLYRPEIERFGYSF